MHSCRFSESGKHALIQLLYVAMCVCDCGHIFSGKLYAVFQKVLVTFCNVMIPFVYL